MRQLVFSIYCWASTLTHKDAEVGLMCLGIGVVIGLTAAFVMFVLTPQLIAGVTITSAFALVFKP